MAYSVMMAWQTDHNGQQYGTGTENWFILKQNPGMAGQEDMDTLIGIRIHHCGYQAIMRFKYSTVLFLKYQDDLQ